MIPLTTDINQKVKVFDCPMLPAFRNIVDFVQGSHASLFVEFYGKSSVYVWTFSVGGMVIARGKPRC